MSESLYETFQNFYLDLSELVKMGQLKPASSYGNCRDFLFDSFMLYNQIESKQLMTLGACEIAFKGTKFFEGNFTRIKNSCEYYLNKTQEQRADLRIELIHNILTFT